MKSDLLNVMKKNLWQFEIDDDTLLEITKKIKRFYFHEDKSFEDLSLDAEKVRFHLPIYSGSSFQSCLMSSFCFSFIKIYGILNFIPLS